MFQANGKRFENSNLGIRKTLNRYIFTKIYKIAEYAYPKA
jgi:hypothetical protein